MTKYRKHTKIAEQEQQQQQQQQFSNFLDRARYSHGQKACCYFLVSIKVGSLSSFYGY